MLGSARMGKLADECRGSRLDKIRPMKMPHLSGRPILELAIWALLRLFVWRLFGKMHVMLYHRTGKRKEFVS